MATPPNALAGAGGSGGANPLAVIMGALANKTSTNPGQSFSQQSSQLQGSDPTMVARQLDQINSLLGTLFIKTFQTQPNLANQISATMKALSRAIKEAGQGAQISEVVGANEPAPPITNSAAAPPQGQQPTPPEGAGI